MKKIIIVGGVAGGATAAARLRRLDESAQIILFERGEYISFANCGLPYYIGDVIENRDALLVQTVEGMSRRFRLDIRNFSQVERINTQEKTVVVRHLQTGRVYEEPYDALILSPGASPIKPPIPGLDSAKNVFTLRNIPDTDAIKAFLEEAKPREAVVVGGGFIGIEMAENLVSRGIRVTLVEMADQVMAPFDFEMAQILHAHLIEKGVRLILGDGVQEFQNQGKTILLSSGTSLSSDLTVLSIGIRPENQLAKTAGLALGSRGHILVNEYLETSVSDIYAVGDAIETKGLVYQEPSSIALASPANRQARIVADRICGIPSRYPGVLGTSVAKVFDLTASSTGYSEKRLKQMGRSDIRSIHIHPLSHAGYYPGAAPLDLKLIFEAPGGKILGAQIIGTSGVEKRVDVIATAISAGMTVFQLQDLELAYAPPFSSAKDPVNMAGYVASNLLTGLAEAVSVSEIDHIVEQGGFLLDVRTAGEFALGSIPGARHLPLDELRDRLSELPKDQTIYVTCQVGLRGYLACRILKQQGFSCVNVDGGYRSYSQLKLDIRQKQLPPVKGLACTDHPDVLKQSGSFSHSKDSAGEEASPPLCGSTSSAGPGTSPHKQIDARGLQCPGPIAKVFQELNCADFGDTVEVLATDPGFSRDISAWCQKMGYTLLELSQTERVTKAVIEKTSDTKFSACCPSSASQPLLSRDGKKATMVVFSGDLDKAIASFIIATGAASMGKEVTMFFTFWGLNILRDPAIHVSKSGMARLFGWMMPKGADKLHISKMNLAGMGTSMIKRIMKQKQVDSLRQLMQRAKEMGVTFVACSMSMDIMGIRREELLPDVEVAGVASYLAEAEEGNLNLFI